MNPLLITLLTLAATLADDNPSVRVRVTKKGLDYMNNLGAKYLQTSMTNREIPHYRTLLGTKGEAKLELKRVRVTSFDTPDIGYKLIPPRGLEWNSQGGQMTVESQFNIEVRKFIRMRGSGLLTANVSGIQFSASVEAYTDEAHKPEINITSCHADITHMDVHFSGGMMAFVLNKFKQTINREVVQLLTKTVAARVRTVGQHLANGKLKSLPLMVPLNDHGLVLDYHMAKDISVTSDFIDLNHKGEVSIMGRRTVGYPPTALPQSNRADHMVLVWVSQYTINSLLASVHQQGMLRIQIDKEQYPHLADVLRTTCENYGRCIGTPLDNLARVAPNQTVTIKLASQAPPICSITKGYSGPKVKGVLDGVMSVVDAGEETVLFTFNVTYDFTVRVNVQRGRLHGKTRIVQLLTNVKETHPLVGRINPLELGALENFIRSELQSATNMMLKPGINIPGLAVLKYEYPDVVMDHESILAFSDMYYTPV